MTKKFILPAILAIILFSCRPSGQYNITGVLENPTGNKLILSELTMDDIQKIDSTRVSENGKFKFSGVIEIPGFYVIQNKDQKYITLAIHPGDQVNLYINPGQFGTDYEVEGSEDSKRIRQLNEKLKTNINKIDSLGDVYMEHANSPDLAGVKERLDKKFEGIIQDHRDYTIRFIRENPGSMASLMALYQQITPRLHVLDPIEDFAYFQMVDSVLFAKYPKAEAIAALHQEVLRNKERIKNQMTAAESLKIGAQPPEIALPGPGGDTIPLSSTRGQYVLLDFWASWCSPCRQENPNLVKNHEKYKNDGFTIYQVSLDRSRQEWIQGIENDSLDGWAHVSDLKYWNSSVVPKYNIQGIPSNYLLNPKGEIIAKDLRGEALERKLKEIFQP